MIAVLQKVPSCQRKKHKKLYGIFYYFRQKAEWPEFCIQALGSYVLWNSRLHFLSLVNPEGFLHSISFIFRYCCLEQQRVKIMYVFLLPIMLNLIVFFSSSVGLMVFNVSSLELVVMESSVFTAHYAFSWWSQII